jgi:hypothetical protein
MYIFGIGAVRTLLTENHDNRCMRDFFLIQIGIRQPNLLHI